MLQNIFNMFVFNTALVFAFFSVIIAADELTDEQKPVLKILTDCGKQWGFSPQDLFNDKMTKEPSENMLCFYKCAAQGAGHIDESGKVIPENFEKFISTLKFGTENKNRIKECLEKVPPVKTCQDMTLINKCLNNL